MAEEAEAEAGMRHTAVVSERVGLPGTKEKTWQEVDIVAGSG